VLFFSDGGAMATTPNNDKELVDVYETQQESEAMVVQGLLESAGIESMLQSEIGAKDVLPVGASIIRVAPENAEEAKRVIEDYVNNPPDVEIAEEGSEG
jgi:hypothetical protein